jgi:hypothetical protein
MHLNKTSRRTLLTSMPAIAAAGLAVGSIGNIASIEATTASAAFRDDELDRQVDPINWPATLERAEGVIERLRTYYGAKWTAADEGAAVRILQYVRDCAAGLPENDDEWGVTLDFFELHGQSLDWVFNGDPVSMIATMAARSTRAMAGG